MRFIVASASAFTGCVKIGTIEAETAEQAICIAAERDGWDASDVGEDTTLGEFLAQIDDWYTAAPIDHVQCYPESR